MICKIRQQSLISAEKAHLKFGSYSKLRSSNVIGPLFSSMTYTIHMNCNVSLLVREKNDKLKSPTDLSPDAVPSISVDHPLRRFFIGH